MSDVVEVGVAYQAARAATAFINANKAAKKGELKKLLDFFRKYFNTQKLDDLINAIGNPNLKNFVVGLRTGDNFLIKQGEGAVNKLSIRTFHNNDFTELASIENNVLTIRKDGILDNGAEMATAQKLANDIEIRGANGENLSGKIEIATDDSGRGWFRVTKGSAIDASLERIRTSNPDMDIASFKADFGNDLDILTKFEKGELSVDSWKRLIDAPDAIRKNVNLLDDVASWPSSWKITKSGDGMLVTNGSGKQLGTVYSDKIVAPGRKVSGETGNALINKNPLVKNMTYDVDGFIYKTDDLGRVLQTNADLDDVVRIRLGNQQIKAVDVKDGIRGTDQGGHIVGSRFFGPGEQINLYPQSANLNQGAWKQMENTWADAMVQGKDVKIQVEAVFNGTSQRPTKFNVKYTVDGQPFSETFINQ